MNHGTYFGHVVEHVTLELSHLIGREVYFGRTLWAGTPGWFRLILECPDDEWVEDPVAEQLLALALGVVTAVAEGRTLDPGPELPRIAALYDESRLGVSAAELARAARERDIPVRRLSDVALLQLGYGCHRQLVWAASTGQTSAIGVDIACDKAVTKQLLAAAGIPVPEGIVVHSAEEAMDAFELPRRARRGQTGVRPPRPERLRRVHRRGGRHRLARGRGRRRAGPGRVICQPGPTTASWSSAAGSPPRRALPGPGNRRRDQRYRCPGRPGQRRPPAGDRPRPARSPGSFWTTSRWPTWPARAWHRRRCQRRAGRHAAHNANLSTGGTSKDVTDSMHPAVARMCARAAAVTGLDVCGIDLRLTDISQPLAAGRASGCVIEINASPGLRMHLHPSEGRPARRGRRHHRPALPARRALPGADRVGDRDQRQDHAPSGSSRTSCATPACTSG